MEVGNEFHILGAAKLKARPPVTVQVLERCWSELRRVRGAILNLTREAR
jgi:hypothetical protein